MPDSSQSDLGPTTICCCWPKGKTIGLSRHFGFSINALRFAWQTWLPRGPVNQPLGRISQVIMKDRKCRCVGDITVSEAIEEPVMLLAITAFRIERRMHLFDYEMWTYVAVTICHGI